MKKLILFAAVLFYSIHHCTGQDLGILRTTLYFKTNGSWGLFSKNEYSKEPLRESMRNFRWENGAWQKHSEERRVYSANGDSITLERTSWEDDKPETVFSRACYIVRDQKNSMVDLVVDGISGVGRGRAADMDFSTEMNQSCWPTNYPFDEVFREAESLKNEGTSIEGRTFVVDWCIYIEFIASSDEFNRIKSFESETRRIEVTYRENGNLISKYENRYKIYPNPFSENLEIDLFDTNIKKVIILNSMGIEVKVALIEGETRVNFNLSDLPAGLYWANIYVEDKVYVQKLIKI
jgi:hypothetical protein